MRGGLFIFGVILLLASLGIQAYYSQNSAQYQLADNICNSGIGNLAQIFSQDISAECQEIGIISALNEFAPLGYILGGVLFLLGLFMSGDSSRKDDEEAEIKILRKRYAKGEITRKEFKQSLEDLKEDNFED